MRASIMSARGCPGCSLSGSKVGHGWLGVPIVRISILILVNCVAEKARATDLDSSQTGYILTPAGNPYNVIAGANIDTTAQGSVIGAPVNSNNAALRSCINIRAGNDVVRVASRSQYVAGLRTVEIGCTRFLSNAIDQDQNGYSNDWNAQPAMSRFRTGQRTTRASPC